MPLVASHDPGNRDGKVHSHRFAAANTAVPYANQDAGAAQGHRGLPEIGLHHGGYLRRLAGRATASGTAMLRRSDTVQASSTFAVGEEAEQTGAAVIRDVGKVAAPIEHRRAPRAGQHGARGRRGAHAQDRPLLPRRHRGRVRCLARTAGQGRRRPRDLLERRRDRRRQGPGGARRALLPSYQLDGEGNPINKRNAWQARSLLYVRLIPPGAADVAHYRVQVPKEARGPIHFTGEAELPQVRLVLHAVRLRRSAEARPGPGAAGPPITTAWSTTSIRRRFRPMSPGNIRGRIPDLPIVTLAKAEASDPARAAQLDAGGAQAGPRALERLGHRPAAARRSERRRIRVSEGDRGRARLCRRLAERGARADPGRRDRCRQAVHRQGAGDRLRSSAASSSSRPPIQKADGDYDGALQSLERVRAAISARPRGAQPDRAASCS